ncbi:hypothetical protein Lser_V15G23945 [Lactuca serriola]
MGQEALIGSNDRNEIREAAGGGDRRFSTTTVVVDEWSYDSSLLPFSFLFWQWSMRIIDDRGQGRLAPVMEGTTNHSSGGNEVVGGK